MVSRRRLGRLRKGAPGQPVHDRDVRQRVPDAEAGGFRQRPPDEKAPDCDPGPLSGTRRRRV